MSLCSLVADPRSDDLGLGVHLDSGVDARLAICRIALCYKLTIHDLVSVLSFARAPFERWVRYRRSPSLLPFTAIRTNF